MLVTHSRPSADGCRSGTTQIRLPLPALRPLRTCRCIHHHARRVVFGPIMCTTVGSPTPSPRKNERWRVCPQWNLDLGSCLGALDTGSVNAHHGDGRIERCTPRAPSCVRRCWLAINSQDTVKIHVIYRRRTFEVPSPPHSAPSHSIPEASAKGHRNGKNTTGLGVQS